MIQDKFLAESSHTLHPSVSRYQARSSRTSFFGHRLCKHKEKVINQTSIVLSLSTYLITSVTMTLSSDSLPASESTLLDPGELIVRSLSSGAVAMMPVELCRQLPRHSTLSGPRAPKYPHFYISAFPRFHISHSPFLVPPFIPYVYTRSRCRLMPKIVLVGRQILMYEWTLCTSVTILWHELVNLCDLTADGSPGTWMKNERGLHLGESSTQNRTKVEHKWCNCMLLCWCCYRSHLQKRCYYLDY